MRNMKGTIKREIFVQHGDLWIKASVVTTNVQYPSETRQSISCIYQLVDFDQKQIKIPDPG